MAVVESSDLRLQQTRELVSAGLWARLVDRIVRTEHMSYPLAERIMDQALVFLQLVARNPGGSFAPSPMVDIGWHTFILYTREYKNFCERVAGHFVHHEPSDDEDAVYDSDLVQQTLHALSTAGFAVDSALWMGRADCENHCSNSSVSD